MSREFFSKKEWEIIRGQLKRPLNDKDRKAVSRFNKRLMSIDKDVENFTWSIGYLIWNRKDRAQNANFDEIYKHLCSMYIFLINRDLGFINAMKNQNAKYIEDLQVQLNNLQDHVEIVQKKYLEQMPDPEVTRKLMQISGRGFYTILKLFSHKGDKLSKIDIMNRCSMRQTRATRLLNKLVDSGFLYHIPSKEHTNFDIYELTFAGAMQFGTLEAKYKNS